MTRPKSPSRLWDSEWEAMKRIRLTAILSLIVMVSAGSNAIASGASQLDGVSERSMFVTMPIYISSMLVAIGCAFTFGRWTSNRESENAQLAERIAHLETLLEAQADDARKTGNPLS